MLACAAVSTRETDRALISAVAAGDRRALATLYDRHGGALVAVGVAILRNRAEAEDVLHDVFVEAWKRAHTYDPARASVRGWLMLRMRSRALDRVRSAAWARRAPQDAAPEESAHSGAETNADLGKLGPRVAALSEPQRAVLEMGYLRGMSSGEIGRALGVPTSTVKSRLAAALKSLREGFVEAES